VNPDAIAAALDLDLDEVPICLACLSFVSMAIDSRDEREIRGWTIKMTPDLWDEGLALPARLAVARAARRGVTGAGEALSELEQRGPRSRIARAIVRRLAGQLSARAKGTLLQMGFEPYPSLN
jgi:hypothetical protein